MYIFKNALRNISRSMGRNILIGIIALVIAISSCVALSIKQSAKKFEEDGLKNLSITASIGTNMDKIKSEAGNDQTVMRALMQKNSSISLVDMQKYAKSSYAKDFTYSLQSSISGSDGFQPYSETDSSTSTTDGNTNKETPKQGGEKGFGRMGQQGDFTIIGYNSENAMADFINGTNKIISGELFTVANADNTCLISDTLASLNNVKVGGKITLTNPNLETETYTLTIRGIYSTVKASDSGMMRFSTAQDPLNYIYTSFMTLNAITNTSASTAVTATDNNGNETTTALRSSVSGTYCFSNVQNLESFKKDVTAMGLSDQYTVTSKDVSSYEQSIIPLKNLSNFANLFLLLVLLIGGIILVVLNIFNIRERKYEVGVLTAIGMKKWKVALQFITELFLVTFIAMIIGTTAGAIVSVPTANKLLESQITSAQSQQKTQNQNFGRSGSGTQNASGKGGNQSINYIKDIKAVTDISVVAQLMGIGILLTMISSCGAVIFILRYEPLKILSNRN